MPQLNSKLDKNDDHHLLRLKDTFIHRQHLCLVFELLSVNLYELIKQNQFRGLSTTLVRVFAQQLLNGLSLLNKARIIHCDLKPENILLKKYVSLLQVVRIKIADSIPASRVQLSKLSISARRAMKDKPSTHIFSLASTGHLRFFLVFRKLTPLPEFRSYSLTST